MISTTHITRLLGDFMAQHHAPTNPRAMKKHITKMALLDLITETPKSFEEIASQHGDITMHTARCHIKELESYGFVEILKRPFKTSKGNTVALCFVRRVDR